MRITAEALEKLKDYQSELQYAKQLKDKGTKIVDAETAGTSNDIPIDEFITKWEKGVSALQAGADPAKWEY